MSFRDRFYTPQVARAMTSPSGIVAGGAGAAIGVLVGLGPIGAVIGAIIAWVARVGIAIPRRQRATSTRIDPFSLGDRWNRLVRDAQQAQHSFDRALRGTPPGPLRDRLDEIRAHLEAADFPKFKWPEFVRSVSALPQSRVGKLDRKSAATLAAELFGEE